MSVLKSALASAVLVATTATGALTLAPATASAAIVCNQWHDCWHTRDRLDYPPGFGIVIHRDDWDYHHRGWHWRGDRFDRGYYRNGVWITF